MYYDEVDIRTIIIEMYYCNDISVRYILFINRFKSMIEKITLFLLSLYVFIDVAMKFKLMGKSREMEFERMMGVDKLRGHKNMVLLKDNSIFELYIYHEHMRTIINSLILESLMKLALSYTMLWYLYRIVIEG